MLKTRGFTLIELLVVIFVVGVLSTVILGVLNGARKKGADAGIRANLDNIRTRAQLIYETALSPSYSGVCSDGNVTDILSRASSNSPVPATCSNAANTWRASAQFNNQNVLNSGSGIDYFCVDQTGISRVEDNDPTGQPSCP